MAQKKEITRAQKLQSLADMILDKLKLRVEAEDPLQLNPQSLKHITGVMKDLRDIQLTTDSAGQDDRITVVFEGELEGLSE